MHMSEFLAICRQQLTHLPKQTVQTKSLDLRFGL